MDWFTGRIGTTWFVHLKEPRGLPETKTSTGTLPRCKTGTCVLCNVNPLGVGSEEENLEKPAKWRIRSIVGRPNRETTQGNPQQSQTTYQNNSILLNDTTTIRYRSKRWTFTRDIRLLLSLFFYGRITRCSALCSDKRQKRCAGLWA